MEETAKQTIEALQDENHLLQLGLGFSLGIIIILFIWALKIAGDLQRMIDKNEKEVRK